MITKEKIQNWLVERLAREMKVTVDQIDVQRSFSTYGIDSLAAVTITADLEEYIHCQLLRNVFWEYPNIALISQYIEELLNISLYVKKISL